MHSAVTKGFGNVMAQNSLIYKVELVGLDMDRHLSRRHKLTWPNTPSETRRSLNVAIVWPMRLNAPTSIWKMTKGLSTDSEPDYLAKNSLSEEIEFGSLLVFAQRKASAKSCKQGRAVVYITLMAGKDRGSVGTKSATANCAFDNLCVVTWQRATTAATR